MYMLIIPIHYILGNSAYHQAPRRRNPEFSETPSSVFQPVASAPPRAMDDMMRPPTSVALRSSY